ncbi:MAG: flagellar biosynthetic protein FliR [Phycisphaerales bacterium]
MPIALEPLLPHIPAFVVVLSRIAGLFLFAPLLSSSAIPLQIKILLVLAFAVSVYPTVGFAGMAYVRLDLYSLAPLMASEMLIGAVIGLLAALPLHAVQLGGLLVGQQIGLGMAQVVNPAMDIEGDNLGQMLFLMTLALFMGMGGIEVLFGGVVHTFAAVGPGGLALSEAPLHLVLGLLASGFDLALRLAMPVLAIIFAENAVMGFVMKTMPTLNIMSFGFPIRIILGLFVLVVALGVMYGHMFEEVDFSLATIERWVAALHGPDVAPGPADEAGFSAMDGAGFGGGWDGRGR